MPSHVAEATPISAVHFRNSKFLLQKREMFESVMLQYQDDLEEYHVAIECSVPFEHVVLWK